MLQDRTDHVLPTHSRLEAGQRNIALFHLFLRARRGLPSGPPWTMCRADRRRMKGRCSARGRLALLNRAMFRLRGCAARGTGNGAGHAADGVVHALSTVRLPVDPRCCGRGMENPSDDRRHRRPAAQTNIAPFKTMQRGASGTTRHRRMKWAMFCLCRAPSETAPCDTKPPCGIETDPRRIDGTAVGEWITPRRSWPWRAVVYDDGCARAWPGVEHNGAPSDHT